MQGCSRLHLPACCCGFGAAVALGEVEGGAWPEAQDTRKYVHTQFCNFVCEGEIQCTHAI